MVLQWLISLVPLKCKFSCQNRGRRLNCFSESSRREARERERERERKRERMLDKNWVLSNSVIKRRRGACNLAIKDGITILHLCMS